MPNPLWPFCTEVNQVNNTAQKGKTIHLFKILGARFSQLRYSFDVLSNFKEETIWVYD